MLKRNRYKKYKEKIVFFSLQISTRYGLRNNTLAYGIKSIVFAPLSQIQHSLTSCARHNLSGNKMYLNEEM